MCDLSYNQSIFRLCEARSQNVYSTAKQKHELSLSLMTKKSQTVPEKASSGKSDRTLAVSFPDNRQSVKPGDAILRRRRPGFPTRSGSRHLGGRHYRERRLRPAGIGPGPVVRFHRAGRQLSSGRSGQPAVAGFGYSSSVGHLRPAALPEKSSRTRVPVTPVAALAGRTPVGSAEDVAEGFDQVRVEHHVDPRVHHRV